MSKSPLKPVGDRPSGDRPAKKAMDFAAERDWPGYFRAVEGKGPRETLVRALDTFESIDKLLRPRPTMRRLALDIGSGEGRDTRDILRRRRPTQWMVTAVDASPEGNAILWDSLGKEERGRTNLVECAMEDLPTRFSAGLPIAGRQRPVRKVDLVNASFSLPFCPPAGFNPLWEWIRGAILPGGRFAGQFFGDRDDWARLPDRTHHTRAQVESLLGGFDVEMLTEEEKDDATATGGWKHWHIFHIVARRLPR